MNKNTLLCIFAILLGSLGLNGCSTATPVVISEWRNPAHAPGSLQRVMIGGPSGNLSVRRNFEDEFVAQLAPLGVQGLPSYRYIPENDEVQEISLRAAAQKAGVDGLLFMRTVKVEEKTKYPAVGPEIGFGVFGSNAAAGWSGIPGASSGPYRYNENTTETVLHDLVKNEVVWTGTIITTDQRNAQAAIQSYVQAVTKSLVAQNLVPKK